MTKQTEIAVVGLGVMGANLALNLADAGHRVVVHNRTHSVAEGFLAGEAGEIGIIGAKTIDQLVELLEPPRVVLMMIKAGDPIDQLIDALSNSLERRRHNHRRGQLALPGHRAPPDRRGEPGTALPGCGHLRRRRRR